MELLERIKTSLRRMNGILNEENLPTGQENSRCRGAGWVKENLPGGLYNWKMPCYNVMRNPARYDRFLSSFGCHQTNVGTHGSNGMAIWDG